MTALAVAALASCNRIDTPEMRNGVLDINVKNGMETKAVIESTTLPSGSEIGLCITDASGMTYDGSYLKNVKYTAVGDGDTQKWTAASDILLSATVANISSYYPYDESVTDLTAIPVETTSEVQTDWMWGTPVSGLDNKNTSATINMNHALVAIKLNIKKKNYFGEGKVTSVSFSSNGAGTSAVMNAITGALTDMKGTGYTFESREVFMLGDDATSVSFITVPVNTAAPLVINMIVDGMNMKVQTADITLLPGNIYECNLTMNMSVLSLSKLNVTKWTIEKMGNVELNPYAPVVNFTGTVTDIYIEHHYKNKMLTIRAYPPFEAYVVNKATVTGGENTQSIDENGVRTIEVTDIVSDVTVTFAGTKYIPWARIQHVNGTLYTAEEWLAAEAAGTVTDADANGIAVRYSKYASCPHVLYSKATESEYSWSSKKQTNVPGLMLISDETIAQLDVNGKSNTDAILAATATIGNAPAAQYCVDFTFPNGEKGYLPAAGEQQAWCDNKSDVEACINAIGGEIFAMSAVWSSTIFANNAVWGFNSNSKISSSFTFTFDSKVRPVCSFQF